MRSMRIIISQLLIIVFGFLILQSYAIAETVWLDSLNLNRAIQGWGKPTVNKTVGGAGMSIAGTKFQRGFGTHSIGKICIALKGGSDRFTAKVGIDDEVGAGRGTVEFRVSVDGKLVWASGIMKCGDPAKMVDVNLKGVKQMILSVSDSGDNYNFDHSDWADASFEVSGQKPETVESGQPTIATTVPSDKPEIHQPLIYGNHPNTPFHFTIPASGREPLKFSAVDLPSGLKLDPSAGIITGMIKSSGAYQVHITVSNSFGKANAVLKLVSGDTIALTPPLGWNSYDAYGDNVTEEEILSNARVMAENLKAHGWSYVVVDYRWYDPGAHDNNANARAGAELSMDKFGRLIPAPNRFPSASDEMGFRKIAEEVHKLGLKFGIHIMRGIPKNAVKANLPIEGSQFHAGDAANMNDKCGWCADMYGVKGNTPAGQAYYDSLFKLYALWGVDFVKVDDLTEPYHTDEVVAVHNAITKCGRSIVFSTSPGATAVSQAKHVGANANMWRLTGDFWDEWSALNAEFDVIANWIGKGGPGYWPDPDMLPLGHLSVKNRSSGPDRFTNFTKAEQVLMLTLWSMAPGPMMIGGNLVGADAWELNLLTNDEVLAINQDALEKQEQRIVKEVGYEIWTKELADGSMAVAVFNRGAEDATVPISLAEMKLDGRYKVRNLWLKKNLDILSGKLNVQVLAHSAVLLKLTLMK